MTTIRLIYSLLLSLSFLACKSTPSERCDIVRINPRISRDKAFAIMDTQKELMAFPGQDSTLKRSSMVSILTGDQHSRQDSLNSNFNTCTAYLSKSDTLHIDIGLHSLFGGSGFIISCYDGRFYTEGYEYSDVVYSGTDKPQHWVICQELTLDRTKYKAGDSLHGYINFKAAERNELGDTIVYTGKGNFRAKVKKSGYNN